VQAEDALANHAAVIRLGGNMPWVNAAEVQAAIEEHTKIDKAFFRVVPSYPDDFFATFTYQHHREQVASPGRFSSRGLDIHITRWSKLAHAELTALNFHVHLCLEGVPFQAWNRDDIGKILGKNCILNYFDVATDLKEDVSAASLWAWCTNPSDLPKVMWVTLIDGPLPAIDVRPDNSLQGKRGLTYKVIVHLDLHEDFSPDADGRPPRHPARERHEWCLGYAAGEQPRRERRAHPADGDRDNYRNNDRRDDDDDRHGRPDDRRTWAGRLFCSRSRADGGRRDAGDRRRDAGRRDDRHDGHGGNRHEDHRDRRRAELPMRDHRRVDPKLFQRLKDGSVIPASGSRRRGRDASPPSARCKEGHDQGSFGAAVRGRSPPPRRLASIICLGADGPTF
jgi:hypothetical protein